MITKEKKISFCDTALQSSVLYFLNGFSFFSRDKYDVLAL